MAAMEIAVEIGTSYTSIFLSGKGLVLREPTVVAFVGDPKQRRVRAVGTQAEEMLGKTPEKTTIVSPVADGFIVDPDSCAVLLRELIRRILPGNYLFLPRIRAILGIPTGLTVEECGRRDCGQYRRRDNRDRGAVAGGRHFGLRRVYRRQYDG